MVIFILIGIIDSGLGAIATLNELIKQHKYATYILYLDYESNPYGTKDEEELLKRLNKAIKFLNDKHCEKIIVACNTLSILTLKCNIKDLITPLPYFKKTIKENIDENSVLIATNYTTNSNFYQIDSRPFSILVDSIEGKSNMNIDELLKELKPYKKIFLGCTHFNLIKKHLKEHLVFDSSEIMAKNINFPNSSLNVRIYITKSNINIINHIIKYIHINRFSINRL